MRATDEQIGSSTRVVPGVEARGSRRQELVRVADSGARLDSICRPLSFQTAKGVRSTNASEPHKPNRLKNCDVRVQITAAMPEDQRERARKRERDDASSYMKLKGFLAFCDNHASMLNHRRRVPQGMKRERKQEKEKETKEGGIDSTCGLGLSFRSMQSCSKRL